MKYSISAALALKRLDTPSLVVYPNSSFSEGSKPLSSGDQVEIQSAGDIVSLNVTPQYGDFWSSAWKLCMTLGRDDSLAVNTSSQDSFKYSYTTEEDALVLMVRELFSFSVRESNPTFYVAELFTYLVCG